MISRFRIRIDTSLMPVVEHADRDIILFNEQVRPWLILQGYGVRYDRLYLIDDAAVARERWLAWNTTHGSFFSVPTIKAQKKFPRYSLASLGGSVFSWVVTISVPPIHRPSTSSTAFTR
ncbi:MAG: hypothetical protein WCS43_16770 [Verrucomicrobiota bacterium]